MEEFKASETKITMGHHHPHTIEMISNLWKRAKPRSFLYPQPLQSNDMNSNATVCRSIIYSTTLMFYVVYCCSIVYLMLSLRDEKSS